MGIVVKMAVAFTCSNQEGKMATHHKNIHLPVDCLPGETPYEAAIRKVAEFTLPDWSQLSFHITHKAVRDVYVQETGEAIYNG